MLDFKFILFFYRKEPEWDIAADNILMKSFIQERKHAPIHAKQGKNTLDNFLKKLLCTRGLNEISFESKPHSLDFHYFFASFSRENARRSKSER